MKNLRKIITLITTGTLLTSCSDPKLLEQYRLEKEKQLKQEFSQVKIIGTYNIPTITLSRKKTKAFANKTDFINLPVLFQDVEGSNPTFQEPSFYHTQENTPSLITNSFRTHPIPTYSIWSTDNQNITNCIVKYEKCEIERNFSELKGLAQKTITAIQNKYGETFSKENSEDPFCKIKYETLEDGINPIKRITGQETLTTYLPAFLCERYNPKIPQTHPFNTPIANLDESWKNKTFKLNIISINGEKVN